MSLLLRYKHLTALAQTSIVLEDSYGADRGGSNNLNDTVHSRGQVFQASVGGKLSSAQFFLEVGGGTPTGNLYAKLYAITGTPNTDAKATGTELAISNSVLASNIPESPDWVSFIFNSANEYQFTKDTWYAIVVEYTSGTSVNYIDIAWDTANDHNGNRTYESSGGTWYGNNVRDNFFKVYSKVIGGGGSGGGSGELLNNNPGFEDSTWENEWSPAGTNGGDWSIGVTTEQKRSGTYALKFSHSNKGTDSFNRCEVVGDDTPPEYDWFTEYWLGLSIRLKDWQTSNAEWNTILQMHTIPNNYDWSSASSGRNGWTIGTKDYGTHRLEFHTENLTESEAYNDTPIEGAQGSYTWQMNPPPQNVWLDFVINWKWSIYNEGFIDVWFQNDGGGYSKIIAETGPNIHRLDTGNRREPSPPNPLPRVEKCQIQMGSYKSDDHTTNRTVYVDNYKLADSSGDFDLVDPSS